MKSINKIISACALLVAVATCHGSQKEQLYVKNETSLPVYVGLYLVGSGNKVTNNTQKAFMIKQGEYATFARQSSKLPGRLQKFIFSSSLNKLAHSVVTNKADEYVFSGTVTPEVSSYKIIGDLERMKLENLDPSSKSGSKSITFYNLKKEVEASKKARKEVEKERKTTKGKANVRGEKLEQLGATSQGLEAESKGFQDSATRLREKAEKDSTWKGAAKDLFGIK